MNSAYKSVSELLLDLFSDTTDGSSYLGYNDDIIIRLDEHRNIRVRPAPKLEQCDTIYGLMYEVISRESGAIADATIEFEKIFPEHEGKAIIINGNSAHWETELTDDDIKILRHTFSRFIDMWQ